MTSNDSWLVLVDKHDNPIGHAEKMYAHENNLLHRAFSIMLLDKQNPMNCLLQQRQQDKYHCSGLWSNSCCSHPKANEPLDDAVHRRLQEELNIDTSLEKIGAFYYQATFQANMHEHEYDHVYIGMINRDDPIKFNRNEIQALQWMAMTDIKHAIDSNPDDYTPWLSAVVEHVKRYSYDKSVV